MGAMSRESSGRSAASSARSTWSARSPCRHPLRGRRAAAAPVATRARRARVRVGDPWKEPDLLVERLMSSGGRSPSQPVLFYDGDADLLLLSRHRERLREAFRFVVPEAELVERSSTRRGSDARAESSGFRCPGAAPGRRARPSAIDLRFPLVVKPLTRQTATWGRLAPGKALHVDDAAALSVAAALGSRRPAPRCSSRSRPGAGDPIESYHAYIDASGEIAGEFTGRKLRTYPRRYGYSTAVTITRGDDVAALGRESSTRLGLRGVVKLDFKRDPDGRLRLLEINPRFNLWHHPGRSPASTSRRSSTRTWSGSRARHRASAPGRALVQPARDRRAAEPTASRRRVAPLGPRVRGQVRTRAGTTRSPRPRPASGDYVGWPARALLAGKRAAKSPRRPRPSTGCCRRDARHALRGPADIHGNLHALRAVLERARPGGHRSLPDRRRPRRLRARPQRVRRARRRARCGLYTPAITT